MGEHQFRPPSEFEYNLLQRLSQALPDQMRERIVPKFNRARVRTVETYEDEYGSIEFQLPERLRRRTQSPLAEGQAADDDGVPIQVILFEIDEEPSELEILRLDGSPIREMPPPEAFEIWASGSPEQSILPDA